MLLILGLSHGIISANEKSVAGLVPANPGADDTAEGIVIAELDEVPAVSIPGSSEEITNESKSPVAKVSKPKISRTDQPAIRTDQAPKHPEQVVGTRTQQLSSTSSSSSGSSSLISTPTNRPDVPVPLPAVGPTQPPPSAPLVAPAAKVVPQQQQQPNVAKVAPIVNEPDVSALVPTSSSPKTDSVQSVPVAGPLVPNVPGLAPSIPVSAPAPGSALRVSIASSASQTVKSSPLNLGSAIFVNPTHAAGDGPGPVAKQPQEKVQSPVIENLSSNDQSSHAALPVSESAFISASGSAPASFSSVTSEAATTKPQTTIDNKITSKRPLTEILAKPLSSAAPATEILPTAHPKANESVVATNFSAPNTSLSLSSSAAAIVLASIPPTTQSEAELKSIPSNVKSLRVTIVGYTGKPVHTFNLTEKQILYQVRVFWLEPENWRDRGVRPPNRLYDLFCWLSNDGAWIHDLLRQNFSAALFSHAQWFAFPEAEQDSKANLTVDCGIRAFNSANKASDWSFSVPAEIHDSPIFLRGFDNVNVKGWTPEEVTHLIKTGSSESRRDSPETPKKAGAVAVAANRRC